VKPRIAVITFPGSNDDRDALRAVKVLGGEPVSVWHADRDLHGADGVILPGGFAYGDYLRTGAIARFAPAMKAVTRYVEAGRPVLGICNGFQVLCEAGLLPGAMLRNSSLSFICRWVNVRTEAPPDGGPGWQPGHVLQLPIKHGEGRWVASAEELAGVEERGQVTLRYCSPEGLEDEAFNPNGSTHTIAGLRNVRGNVLGLMPHPEHAVDPDLGPTGGIAIFEWLFAMCGAEVRA
jgi:phosphoribosylformylglycinamidine synthase